MLVPLTPLIWCSVQIGLLTTFVLIVALLLRFRRPQFTSALFACAGLAIVALSVVAWIPMTQWSLAKWNRLSPEAQLQQRDANLRQPTADSESSVSAADAFSHSTASSEQNNPLTIDSSSRSQALQRWIETAKDWAFNRVQQVDDRVRAIQSSSDQLPTLFSSLQICFFTLLAAFGLLWTGSWLWMRSMIRSSQSLNDSTIIEQVLKQSDKLGLNRLPQLRTSTDVAVGATVGCRRKYIILNSNWQQWSDIELEAVLLHELAHIARNDYAWVMLSSWLRVLLFYHPLVHLMVRRWRMEQELAADQLAAGAMNNAKAYGRALASLALRFQSGTKMPCPVLTAEQVCIVRRVTMLKNGSLKPSHSRWRGSALWMTLTVFAMLPLTGLRGTPVLDDDDATTVVGETTQAIESSDEKRETTEAEEAEKQKQQALELKQVQIAFPPLELIGRMKWNPSKLLSDDVSPTARYLQDLVAFAFFEQFPEGAEINCPATAQLRWQDMEREHGQFTVGATADETRGLEPKLAMRLLSRMMHGTYEKSSITKMIAGHKAIGLVVTRWDRETNSVQTDNQPSLWLVESGDSFYYGSEEDVAKRIESGHSKDDSGKAPLVELPAVYQGDYDQSGIAVVYNDCKSWPARLNKFVDGSPHQAKVAVAYPYLTGLEYVGLFVTGNQGLRFQLRMTYDSTEAAERGLKAISGLIALGKLAVDEEPLPEILSSLQINQVGSDVQLELVDNVLLEKIALMILSQKLPGWNDILTDAKPDGAGSVLLESGYPLAQTGFLSQSVKAAKYAGQRVRFSAEIGATNTVHERSGVIVWGSDVQATSLGNATSGNSIGQTVDLKDAWEQLLVKPQDLEFIWHTRTVEWDVPHDAAALSFGIYTAAGEVTIRNAKFEVVGPASSSQPEVALKENLPRNLLHIPALPLLDEPTNLDFMKSNTTQSDEAAARTAEVETRNTEAINR